MITHYENLANAIIIKAYKDYKRALRIIVKTSAHKKDLSESEIKKRRKAFRIKRDVESFFHSPWYRELTDDFDNLMSLCKSCHSSITLAANNKRRG